MTELVKTINKSVDPLQYCKSESHFVTNYFFQLLYMSEVIEGYRLHPSVARFFF